MSLADIQNSRDYRGVTLQKVGVKDIHIPIQILTYRGEYQWVLGRISLCTDLTQHYRGTHMSRFVEIITKWSNKKFSSKELKEVLLDTCKRLNSESAQGSISFKYFIEKESPVTHSKGYMDYDCTFYGFLMGENYSFVLGVDVPIQTLCPCSKEIAKYGAHNQRAVIKIKLEYYPEEFVWIEEIIKKAESCGSSPLYPVIKREDEKHITEKAYENPRFVEDVTRDMVKILRDDHRIRWFEVECKSYESIHNHNAFAFRREYKKRKNEQGLIPIEDIHFMF